MKTMRSKDKQNGLSYGLDPIANGEVLGVRKEVDAL
jgi:hypothetical protein